MVTELAIGADGGELQGDRADPERREGSNAVMEGKTGQFLPAARCLGKLRVTCPQPVATMAPRAVFP